MALYPKQGWAHNQSLGGCLSDNALKYGSDPKLRSITFGANIPGGLGRTGELIGHGRHENPNEILTRYRHLNDIARTKYMEESRAMPELLVEKTPLQTVREVLQDHTNRWLKGIKLED